MTLEELKQYYKKASSGEKERIIKHLLIGEKPLVVYGGVSINVRLPEYLQGVTLDWDIYSHNAGETAHRLEKLLDQEFGGDYFEVLPAKHPQTFRVVSKVTSKVVADITLPDKTIKYQFINGIRYATLDEQAYRIKRTLADPEKKFRWNKDEETLQRIAVFREEQPAVEKDRPIHRMRKHAQPEVKGW